MYAVLGEHRSDAETLKVLIRKIARKPHLNVKIKGYEGGGELKRKGAKQITLFAQLYGCSRFVVCHDADGPNPTKKRQEIEELVTGPSGQQASCCIVIPVQELEAWVLADIGAVTHIFTGWKPKPIKNPEAIASPKEYLEKLSSDGASRPRYSHAVHNPRVAAHLDIQRLRRNCPSFMPLVDFVTRNC